MKKQKLCINLIHGFFYFYSDNILKIDIKNIKVYIDK